MRELLRSLPTLLTVFSFSELGSNGEMRFMQLNVLKLVKVVCGLVGIQHLMVKANNMGERDFAARPSFTSDLWVNPRFLNAGLYT